MDEKHSEIILYEAPNGQTKIDVLLDGDTIWLNQSQIIALFERDQSVISRHIRNVFAEGEVDEKSNMQKMHIANSDKPVTFYSLDVIISVGYRVNSHKATQFRIWATKTLREFIIKGFVLDDERLKLGKRFGGPLGNLLPSVSTMLTITCCSRHRACSPLAGCNFPL